MFSDAVTYASHLIHELSRPGSGVALLCIIVIAALIVLDAVTLAIGKTKRETGLAPKATGVSLDGSKELPVRHYFSARQALAGRPDALISEGGFIIPIERKPLARKIRDRYIAQLLVYMRLVEEFEGKRPPYGYLILGPKCRKIKIENSPKRQAWLQSLIDEMRGILNGKPAQATPQERKCLKCDVRSHCEFAAQPADLVPQQSRSSSILKSRA